LLACPRGRGDGASCPVEKGGWQGEGGQGWRMENRGAGGYGFWAGMIAWRSKAALKRPQSRRSANAERWAPGRQRVGDRKAASRSGGTGMAAAGQEAGAVPPGRHRERGGNAVYIKY